MLNILRDQIVASPIVLSFQQYLTNYSMLLAKDLCLLISLSFPPLSLGGPSWPPFLLCALLDFSRTRLSSLTSLGDLLFKNNLHATNSDLYVQSLPVEFQLPAGNLTSSFGCLISQFVNTNSENIFSAPKLNQLFKPKAQELS